MALKTLYYGVAGEGRGHATRAFALIEQLHERHRVVVYSYGQALSLLRLACAPLDVEVRSLPPLEFAYSSRRTLSYTRTFFKNVGYLKDLSDIFLGIQHDMERDKPDLIISDFEPVLPRVGRRLDIPFLSVDHQHFLLNLRGIRERLLESEAITANPRCVALSSHLRLYPNGDVPTCQFNSKIAGNLRHQPFEEVWTSARTEGLRDWVRKCPGCWAECEVLPNAVYSGELLQLGLSKSRRPSAEAPSHPQLAD